MPMRRQSSFSARSSSVVVVDFGDRVHVPILRGGSKVARRRVIDFGQDDQDAVGAPGARLCNLVGVDHEVLA